jgi:hypothetical protein
MNARAPRSCKLFASSHITSPIVLAGVCLSPFPFYLCLDVHLFLQNSLLLHGVDILDRSNIRRSLTPVSLDLNPELCHGDTEQFE